MIIIALPIKIYANVCVPAVGIYLLGEEFMVSAIRTVYTHLDNVIDIPP